MLHIIHCCLLCATSTIYLLVRTSTTHIAVYSVQTEQFKKKRRLFVRFLLENEEDRQKRRLIKRGFFSIFGPRLGLRGRSPLPVYYYVVCSYVLLVQFVQYVRRGDRGVPM